MSNYLQTAPFYVVPILIILGIVVTVHEGGHFLVARWLGTAVERFSIGFGRPLAEWRGKSGVQYRIGWIPLGGYVKFAGDENAASLPDAASLDDLRREIVSREGEAAVARYFHFKPLWQRAIIVAAGPAANFLLAIVVFAALLMTIGEQMHPARVDAVRPGTPAAAAGFHVGDHVLSANGHHVGSFDDISQIVMFSTGTPIAFTIQRGSEVVQLDATPVRGTVMDRLGHPHRMGVLGIEYRQRSGDVQWKRYDPAEAVVEGVKRTYSVVDTTVLYIRRMIVGRESADQLSGPIGMAQLSGQLAKETADESPNLPILLANAGLTILGLVANISVGVGFLNLMPIPALDGGHLLFYAYEAVARRPLAAKVQAAGYRVGLALVLGLMLFATWNDLQRLRVLNFLGGLFS
jgi:regulator of sigma E protease